MGNGASRMSVIVCPCDEHRPEGRFSMNTFLRRSRRRPTTSRQASTKIATARPTSGRSAFSATAAAESRPPTSIWAWSGSAHLAAARGSTRSGAVEEAVGAAAVVEAAEAVTIVPLKECCASRSSPRHQSAEYSGSLRTSAASGRRPSSAAQRRPPQCAAVSSERASSDNARV